MRDFFFKDFGWKLFSLLLAAFIWYTVHKIIEEPKAAAVSPANRAVTYGDVPVSIVATAATDTHGYNVNSNIVSVTVSGPPDRMDMLQEQEVRATVDLSDFNPNTKEVERPVDVSVPWGIAVVSVEPAELKVIPPKK